MSEAQKNKNASNLIFFLNPNKPPVLKRKINKKIKP